MVWQSQSQPTTKAGERGTLLTSLVPALLRAPRGSGYRALETVIATDLIRFLPQSGGRLNEGRAKFVHNDSTTSLKG